MRLETKRDRVVRYGIGYVGMLIALSPYVVVQLVLLVPLIPASIVSWLPIKQVILLLVFNPNGLWYYLGSFVIAAFWIQLVFNLGPRMIYANYGKKAV